MDAALPFFVVGYPLSIAMITRWLPIVRQRRLPWFVVHQVAVLCIVIGWAIRARWPAVAVNSSWLVTAAAWYAASRRR